MSCCLPPPEFIEAVAGPRQVGPSDDELRLASRPIAGGLRQSDLSVPTVHCGGCVHKIEKALRQVPGVAAARVNLSTRRLAVQWQDGATVPPVIPTLLALGYEANLFDPTEDDRDPRLRRLIVALAVAAFCSMNIMMLSGSVWSGADGPTRGILHWICALLTLPVLLYSCRVFYESAWHALRHGRTNMDVPITIGLVMAFLLSIYDTITLGDHAYYDATATLAFFLLIGRTLDHVMRERARIAVRGLARLAPRGALALRDSGGHEYLPVSEIVPGTILLISAGERIPVDAEIISGRSELDRSLVSGESAPHPVQPGERLEAGTLNLTAPLTVRCVAAEQDSFLAEMVRLMEVAEGGQQGFRRLADRVAQYYSPVVHFTALIAFAGWMILSADLHLSATVAVAVLIITCPCALGLAVPMVQVMAARRLFERGVMVKDGGALERLETIDTVVFDKTGTLTTGQPVLTNAADIATSALAVAATLAVQSRHPHALAVVKAADGLELPPASDVTEVPGCGMEARLGGSIWRLGRAEWALEAPKGIAGTVLSRDGRLSAEFRFIDQLRPGAAAAIRALQARGLAVEIVSGDQPEAVAEIAGRLGVTRWSAAMQPAMKLARLAELRQAGHRVLMVGDGLNDAPALVAADVSMAPANAADVGRNAAGFVFLREPLTAVPETLDLAQRAARLVRQNLALALAYNVIAIPIAVLGYATPFVAAIAMSLSSVVVVFNAMRLGWRTEHNPRAVVGRLHEAPAEVQTR